MKKANIFSKSTLQKIKSAQEARILDPVQIGGTKKQNELVFFIKPELLNTKDEKIFNTLQLIKSKFIEFNVEISGAAIVTGAYLEKHEIMNRHYGYINQLSRMASKMVDAEIREQMFDLIKREDDSQHMMLGGHEFLKFFATDVSTLSDQWFAQPANKLRSGFYFIEETFHGQPVLLVNGFHPSQLGHFTKEDHRIYLMLLHTNTDWYALKFDLVGDTFPERAKPESIRGMLFADPEHYGQEEVGINSNGVHLSAGPFEAAFEVVNFFGPLLDIHPEETPPLVIRRAVESGLPKQKALTCLENPPVNGSDLFSKTENMNTRTAVDFVLDLMKEA
jgi:hypothetical protein